MILNPSQKDEDSQPDVHLSQLLAEPERSLPARRGQVRLGPVERLEECPDVALVGLLRGREAGLVDAVVDLVVVPLVGLVDLRLQGGWVQYDVAVLVVQVLIELEEEGGTMGSQSSILSLSLTKKEWELCMYVCVLTTVPSMRRISLLSLFTMHFCFLSYKTGTVKRPS